MKHSKFWILSSYFYCNYQEISWNCLIIWVKNCCELLCNPKLAFVHSWPHILYGKSFDCAGCLDIQLVLLLDAQHSVGTNWNSKVFFIISHQNSSITFLREKTLMSLIDYLKWLYHNEITYLPGGRFAGRLWESNLWPFACRRRLQPPAPSPPPRYSIDRRRGGSEIQ